nr:DDE-type integrase/transposase/recombinase [Neisseria dentiae]
MLQNQKATDPRDYLFVAIDDFSRELYAAILPDRTAASAAKFLLRDVIDCCPYTIECAYSDNGVEIVAMRSTRLALPVCKTT